MRDHLKYSFQYVKQNNFQAKVFVKLVWETHTTTTTTTTTRATHQDAYAALVGIKSQGLEALHQLIAGVSSEAKIFLTNLCGHFDCVCSNQAWKDKFILWELMLSGFLVTQSTKILCNLFLCEIILLMHFCNFFIFGNSVSVVCSPGSYRKENNCQPCPNGTYQSTTSAVSRTVRHSFLLAK